MTYLKQLVLFALVALFISSCAKLPVYNSKDYVQPEQERFLNPMSLHFDEKTNINFGIADNDTNLFIQAIFHDRGSYTKIMRGGLNIYFYPGAKKKKKYQLKIERLEKQNNDLALMTQRMGVNADAGRKNMAAIIGATFNKVTWDKNGDEFIFNRIVVKEPIGVDLYSGDLNELILEIKMPLKEIPLNTDQNIFSLGIESGEISSSGGMNGKRPPGGGMSRGAGAKMQGGGMQGRRGGHMRSNDGQRPTGTSPSGMKPLKVWFQVQL